MPTSPMILTPLGGLPYKVLSAHLLTMYGGAWVLDLDLAADDVAIQGAPSGKVTALIGGVPLVGTVDSDATGVWGPTAKARIVAGGGAWDSYPAAQQFHADAPGVASQVVYSAVAGPLLEVVVDLEPRVLGIDVVISTDSPASAIFGDRNYFVDITGTTYVGPRPPAIPDLSLVIRNFDPLQQKVTFSCETLLLPNTPLVDPRFGTKVLVAYNVEQIFDANGSTGWAWAQPAAIPGLQASTPPSTVVDMLKAAVLAWTRAASLRVYRYRYVLDAGAGPGGGPDRMALQAVSPSAGMPNLLPITPWSGMAGIVAELAPSQEVLVVFENADPTLPRIIGYSLVPGTAVPLGLPLKNTIDAAVKIDIGPTAPLIEIGGPTATPVMTAAALAALTAFATSLGGATDPAVTGAASTLLTALGKPNALTLKTKAA